MGIMDQINANLPPAAQRLEGSFATASDRAALWVNKTPFEISAPPQVRAKNPQFVQARPDGSMPDPNEWWIEIRLLEPRPDGSFGYVLQDDGEGAMSPVNKILTMSCGPIRNAQMQALGEYVQAHGSAGPLRLDKGQSQGKGQPPWVFVDWAPVAQPAYVSSYQGYQSSPPPTGTAMSPSAATPMAPPPAPSPVVPVPPPPPADLAPPPPPSEPEYQYHTRSDGKRFRWRAGMAGWEECEPEGVSAQPLPATRVVEGFVNTEGGPSERVRVEVADGSQMRQAVYQGEGAVRQPSGVVTQNGAPETAATGAQGTIGVEAQATAQRAAPSTSAAPAGTVVPTPAQQPAPSPQSMAGQVRQAFEAGKQVMIALQCPQCNTEQKGPAFRRPQDGTYVQTHVCKAAGKTVILNATEAVKAAAGVS